MSEPPLQPVGVLIKYDGQHSVIFTVPAHLFKANMSHQVLNITATGVKHRPYLKNVTRNICLQRTSSDGVLMEDACAVKGLRNDTKTGYSV